MTVECARQVEELAARADHRIDTSAGDGARTLICDEQLPHIGIKRSDRTLD